MKKKNAILMSLLCLIPYVCVAQGSLINEEKPRSIVIMPPINKTNHVEAKDFFYSSLYIPLCDYGYYVFPPMLTMDMFQTESAYDSEQFVEGNLTQFREVLGADAAMFTVINDWRRANAAGIITVNISYILRSTKSNATLWENSGSYTINQQINTGQGGLFGALLDLTATMISTASTDKIEAARGCNLYMLSSLPVGPYHPNYKQ